MRTRVAVSGAAILACALALAAAAPFAKAAVPPRGRFLDTARDTVDPRPLYLGRAAMEQSLGNLRGVVENLETIDFSAESSFAEADRAAFLLGQAYRALGSTDRFAALARTVSEWPRRSVYTDWLEFQLKLVEADGVPARDSTEAAAAGPFAPHTNASPAADALAAALLLRAGEAEAALRLIERVEAAAGTSPLTTHVKAVALSATGGDDARELVLLSSADTTTALGRDLAGAAILRRATRALERGEDARPLLATVPAGSRYTSRGRHMLGLAALERGDLEGGRAILESLLAEDSSYAAHREVRLAIAGQSLDRGEWESAHDAFQEVDRDWGRHRDALRDLLANAAFDTLWAAWESATLPSEALVIDASPAERLARELTAASLDLTARPAVSAPTLGTEAPARGFPWPVAPPPSDSLFAIRRSARSLGEAEHKLERARWALAREQETLEGKLRYFGVGLERARRETLDLAARSAQLDSLRATLDRIDARLVAVRDEATRRIIGRTAEVLVRCANQTRWMGGMRHFHVEGPNRERAVEPPSGFPSADATLRTEQALVAAIQALVERIAGEAPGLIARSYERAWRPGLIDRAAVLGTGAERSLAWARALASSIDSNLVAAAGSEALRLASSQLVSLGRSTDSLRASHEALRARVARAAVERALVALDAEREAIDYGLAAAAYGASVRLVPHDSSGAAAEARPPVVHADGAPGAPDTTRVGRAPEESLEDPDAARRQIAIGLLRTFLDRHAQSFARGEMRFRLADLLLLEAREDFRARMARFVQAQSAGGPAGAPPRLDTAPALALYRAILAEDHDFAHRDAVLFNAGMILADDADGEAMRFFEDLVATHPASLYVPEACLRMGDLDFGARRFGASIPLYERAAAGPDPSLRAVALYKMGWAHFNQERFLEAADAFRSALDLYAAESRPLQVDLAREVEGDLIQSLARVGGPGELAGYFNRIGARPYERRVLMALGQHHRRYSLFAQAAAVDSLCLGRYPLEAEALVSAERLVETYQRWDRSERARAAQLELAPRFAPGGEWARAQRVDSVRTAGAAFARSAWRSVALHHHLEARRGGSPEDWRRALDLYEALLSRWPDDPETPLLELHAGEASAHLGSHAAALAHYRAAARAGPDSVASKALLQRVAVTDAWYESTRSAGGPAGAATPGSDSLARGVLEAADELLARYPETAAGADLRWRQGHLAFAHGWFEPAATVFGSMAARHPDDRRAPHAAELRATALFRVGQFEAAGTAYEEAAVAARRAGIDSLARRAEQAVPVCAYRHAEAAVAADSSAFGRHAALFENVAERWPGYEHAPLAQYRAALAHLRGGSNREAIRALQTLIRNFPTSEYVRDAHLEIAKAWEAEGQGEPAGQAYAAFAERYPDDASARGAWLKAADLFAAAGLATRADDLRLAYVRRFPDDAETAMEIFEELARRDLKSVGSERPISTVLGNPGQAGAGKAAPSHLAEYLRRAASHPDLASRALLAEVRFLEGEEAYAAYHSALLRQPLDQSIPAKQKLLDAALARYQTCVDLGVAEWAHAATFRIGQALVAFGVALEQSERPADLKADDLLGYEDVLREQSQAFFDRGEGVWTELLRQRGRGEAEDAWMSRAQASLWQRIGDRFAFRPEVEFPLVAAAPAERVRPPKGRRSGEAAARGRAFTESTVRAQREGNGR